MGKLDAAAADGGKGLKGPQGQTPSVLVIGVGAFAHSTGQILKDTGANVSTYLSRSLRPFSALFAWPGVPPRAGCLPRPCWVKEKSIDLVLPMSIDWAQAAWARRPA
jgi:hypothetical protein